MILSDAFQKVIASHVPIKRLCRFSNPWWSPHLGELRSKVIQYKKAWIKNPTTDNKRALNNAKRELKINIFQAKRESWKAFCENTPFSDYWTSFKKIMRARRNDEIHELIVDGHHITDDQGRAEALANRFFPTTTPPDDDFHLQVSSNVRSFLQDTRQAKIVPITPTELYEALFASAPWKAPRPDQIPLMALRQCEDILTPYLLALYTTSLRLQYVPTIWKIAKVVAVPKPNADLSVPKGFRPISLLLCISKTLEHIITRRLTHYLEQNSFLSPHQYGFRKAHATEWALWNFVSAATDVLKTRNRLMALKLDIQGAYDRVWHTGLLNKLICLHVSAPIVGWIASFLTNRSAQFQVGSTVITPHLTMGVPQGSPLSPILFLVYIQDLLEDLSAIQGVSSQAYADDVFVYWRLPRDPSRDALGPQIAHTLTHWAYYWKATYGLDKCKYMVIGRVRAPPPSFSLGDTSLECVPSMRYLGVIIDSKLSWDTHVRYVAQKAKTKLQRLFWGLATTWGFHPIIAHHMIEATILPILFYASPAWSSIVRFPSKLKPINTILRQAAIAIMGLYRTTSHEAARFITGFMPAELYIRQYLVEFYLRHLTYGHDLL